MGISDRSLVDASLVAALGACLGGGDEKAAASAVCALNSLVDLTGSVQATAGSLLQRGLCYHVLGSRHP